MNADRRKVPEPSRTRTNHDWIMMCLGAFLILFFLIAGWLALAGKSGNAGRKIRGPVKDPKASQVPREIRVATGFGLHNTESTSWLKRFPVPAGDSRALH